MSGLLVVVRFRAVYRLCFLASCSPLGKDLLVVKLHCFGLQHFGEREGLRSRGLLAASGFTQIWLTFVFCRVLLLAVRLEVRVVCFLRMRLRLLYSFCVVICWGRARRAPHRGPWFSYDDGWCSFVGTREVFAAEH